MQSKTFSVVGRNRAWVLGILAAFCYLCFPGSMRFLGDELGLILSAHQWNESGRLASHGADWGRVPYGPFSVWCCQLLLWITHDLAVATFLKSFLSLAICCGCLVWAQRLFPGFWKGFGWVAVFSPCLWFFCRALWDNSFLVPLSALMTVSYLAFCQAGKSWQLALAFFALTCGLLTHLMVGPLVLAIGLHFLWYHHGFIRKHWAAFASIVVLCLLVASPYLYYLLVKDPRLGHVVATSKTPLKHLGGFLNALLLPRYFTLVGFDYFLGWAWWLPMAPGYTGFRVAFVIPYLISFLILPLFFSSMARAGLISKGHSLEKDLAIVFALAWGFHFIVSCQQTLGDFAHYFNALWMPAFLVFWMGVSKLIQSTRWRKVAIAYALSLVVALPLIGIYLWVSSGGLPSWGIPVSVQEQAARHFACSPRAFLRTVPPNYSNPQNTLDLAALYRGECNPESLDRCSVVEIRLHEALCLN